MRSLQSTQSAAAKNRVILPRVVCVYYCSTYYKAVRGGGGGVEECTQIYNQAADGQSSPLPCTYLGICNYVELIDTIFTDVEGVD